MDSSEHLAAFMNGVEFVLLGFEGRLHAAGLDAETEAEVRAFIAEYKAVLANHRAREAGADAPALLPVTAGVAARLN